MKWSRPGRVAGCPMLHPRNQWGVVQGCNYVSGHARHPPGIPLWGSMRAPPLTCLISLPQLGRTSPVYCLGCHTIWTENPTSLRTLLSPNSDHQGLMEGGKNKRRVELPLSCAAANRSRIFLHQMFSACAI